MRRAARLPPGRATRGLAACAGLLGAGAIALGAPSTSSPPVPPPRPRADWLADGAAALWAGRLGEAQRAFLEIADREVGHADPALDYWSELSALLRCEPQNGSVRSNRRLANEWDRLRRLAQIERIRLGARLAKQGEDKPSDTRAFPLRPAPAGALEWPVEAERWPDEAPAAANVIDRCAAPDHTPEGQAADTTIAPLTAGAARSLEVTLVRDLTAALPDGYPALPALLLEETVLAVAAGEPASAIQPLEHLEALSGSLPPGAPGRLSPAEAVQATLSWALASDALAEKNPERRDSAIARMRAALAADLSHDVRRALTFRLSEVLAAAGRADEAADIVGPPPHGDDQLGRYLAFRQMAAHVHAGRRAQAIAEAREALGKHNRAAVDADPALAAIDDLGLRLLVGSPITAESIELIEAFGTPSERLARMERFAQMAGASRSHGSEMAAFLWLRDNDPDVNRQLHHLARASVAAARAGDKKQFALTFAELAGQGGPEGAAAKPGAKPDAKLDPKTGAKPDAKAEAAPAAKDPTAAKPRTTGLIDSPEAERLYRTRQREQSLSWQRAMLIVARDALPSLVDNDDQTNLKILVDRLQQHLTAHGRGPVDAELTTVYRAASAHLKTGARAYAERVGKTKRPLLLGEIAVERHYDVSVPRVTVTPRGPRSLLWVPVAGNDPSAARLRHWTAPLGVTVAATGTTGLASATASAPAPAPAKAAPTVGTP